MADVDFTTMLCEPELVMITTRTVLFAYINLGINNIYLTNFMVLMLCLFGNLFKICFLLAKDYGKIDKPPSFLLPRIIMREKHEMRVNYAWVFLVIFLPTVWLAYEKYIFLACFEAFFTIKIEHSC